MPRVFEAYQAQVRQARSRSPRAVVVLDAALLIETGYHRKMDRVVVVYAEPEQQLERLICRDRFTKDEALARIGSQMPLAEKRALADYVIENNGDLDDLKRQVRDVWTKLVPAKQSATR